MVDPILDCLNEAALYDLHAGAAPLRRRLLQHATARTLIDAHVFAAPVHFGRLFHLEPEGTWAVLAPMTNERGEIINVAAFDPNGHGVATLNLSGFAIGLEEIFEARLDDQFRPRVHATVWSWLRAECTGLLPVDWRRTSLHLLERGVGGLLAYDVPGGQAIERRLAKALRPPPIFVSRDAVAA